MYHKAVNVFTILIEMCKQDCRCKKGTEQDIKKQL